MAVVSACVLQGARCPVKPPMETIQKRGRRRCYAVEKGGTDAVIVPAVVARHINVRALGIDGPCEQAE